MNEHVNDCSYQAAASKRYRIIDKDADIYRGMLSAVLRDKGIEFVPHQNQKEGIDSISTDDVVLLGVTGNGVDTFLGGAPWAAYSPKDAIRMVREKGARVIIYTGEIDYGARQAEEDGAHGFIEKPKFDIESIRRVLTSVAEGREGFHAHVASF